MDISQRIKDEDELFDYDPEEQMSGFVDPKYDHNDVDFIEEEVGLQLTHMLALGGLFVASILIISLLWNYCAGDSGNPPATEDDRSSSDNTKREVVVSEVRPGLILIQGSPTSTETLRIIQEYDLMKNKAETNDNYGAMAGPPVGHLYQPGTMAAANDSQLIDFNHEPRPPPYAPN